MGVVCRRFVVSFFVVLGGIFVVLRRMFVVLRCPMVMFCRLL
jgi:hypothetical protein